MDKSITKQLLSPSVFTTKATDSLATLDVYTKSDKNVVNKIQDIGRLFDVDTTNIMKGGAIISKHFPAITGSIGSAVNLNMDNLTARIASISSSVSSVVGKVEGSIKSAVGSIKLPDTVYSVVAGVKSKLSSVNISGLTELTGVVQDVVEDRQIMQLVDPSAKASLYLGLISEASRSGIPDSFSSVVGKLDDPNVRDLVLKNSIPYAINTSDVRMLGSLLSGDSTNGFLFDSLRVIQDFSKNYKAGYGYDTTDGNGQFTDLFNTYTLIDPNWYKAIYGDTTNPTTLIDLTKVLDASSDFKDALIQYLQFSIDPTTDLVLLGLSKVFDKTTVEAELKNLLPAFVLTEPTVL